MTTFPSRNVATLTGSKALPLLPAQNRRDMSCDFGKLNLTSPSHALRRRNLKDTVRNGFRLLDYI